MLWHSQSSCIRFACFRLAAEATAGDLQWSGIHKATASRLQAICGRAANAAAGRVQCSGIPKATAAGSQALDEVPKPPPGVCNAVAFTKQLHQVGKLWPGLPSRRRASAMLCHSQSSCIRFASSMRAAQATAGRVQCSGIHKAAALGCHALAEVTKPPPGVCNAVTFTKQLHQVALAFTKQLHEV